MRIAFLTHYFPPEGNAPASRVHAMAKHWVRGGHAVDVITCAPNVPAGIVYDGYENRLFQRETVDGIEVTRVWTYLAANAGFAKRIANYLSFLVSAVPAALVRERPDVVVATSPQPFCGWAGAVVATLRRVPFVLEIRDIWPESIVAVGAMKRSLGIRLLRRLAAALYRRADRIVTVGEGYRQELVRAGVPAEKIDIVPNGVDSEVFSPQPAPPETRERWALGDAFVCSYVGTVGMASGLDVVLHCARLLREHSSNVRFLIVGDGAERARLEAEARRDRLDAITFTGRLEKSEIPGILAASDCCLVHLRAQPLFETVLPSKMFEAAAMAKPTILGVRGEAKRLLADLDGGIAIEPESAEQLRDALRQLSENPTAAASMGRNAHRRASERFSRKRLAEEYLGALAALVQSSRVERAQPTRVSPSESAEGTSRA